MKFLDAYILARTKRKTRRIRMALVVIVSSLLFALLFGLAFISQGIINAGKQVGDVGFNARNLTLVTPNSMGGKDYEATYKSVQAAMDGELKARKIKVTDQTRQDASYLTELTRRLDKLAAEEQAAALAKIEARIHTLGKPSGLYHFSPFGFGQMAQYQPDPAVDPLVEEIKRQKESGGGTVSKGGSFDSQSQNLEFYSAEAGLFRTQLAPGQTVDWQPGQAYPIIVSYSFLEKLGNKSLSQLPPAQRNQGYRELIQRFTGHELPFCYRNSTAQDQLRSVMQYNTTAQADTDPSTKSISVPICAGFDQKELKKLGIISDDNPTGAKPLFPPAVIPGPETLQRSFKIVGFVPAQQQYGTTDVITQMLVGISSLPTGPNAAVVPSEVVARDAVLKSVREAEGGSYATLFVDFKARQDQKAFMKHACSGNECGREDALFMVPFGNIATALESVFGFVSKALLIAASIIMVIAGLMIMLTISKVIADSTKEIAVFRSLGARRRDIAQIYYTYGTMLAGSALVIALALAAVGAFAFSAKYDEKLAQGLIQASGAYNSQIEATLVGFNMQWLAGITAALLAAALIGITLPVLVSVRRKLITILREE